MLASSSLRNPGAIVRIAEECVELKLAGHGDSNEHLNRTRGISFQPTL